MKKLLLLFVAVQASCSYAMINRNNNPLSTISTANEFNNAVKNLIANTPANNTIEKKLDLLDFIGSYLAYKKPVESLQPAQIACANLISDPRLPYYIAIRAHLLLAMTYVDDNNPSIEGLHTEHEILKKAKAIPCANKELSSLVGKTFWRNQIAQARYYKDHNERDKAWNILIQQLNDEQCDPIEQLDAAKLLVLIDAPIGISYLEKLCSSKDLAIQQEALLYHGLLDPEEGAAILENLITKYPESTSRWSAQLALGQCFIADSAPNKGINYLEDIIYDMPLEDEKESLSEMSRIEIKIEACRKLIEYYIKNDNYDDAVTVLEELETTLLESNPPHQKVSTYFLQIVENYFQLGCYNKAQEILTCINSHDLNGQEIITLANLNAKLMDSTLETAIREENAGNLSAAIDGYNRIRNSPTSLPATHDDATMRLANIYFDARDYINARPLYLELVEYGSGEHSKSAQEKLKIIKNANKPTASIVQKSIDTALENRKKNKAVNTKPVDTKQDNKPKKSKKKKKKTTTQPAIAPKQSNPFDNGGVPFSSTTAPNLIIPAENKAEQKSPTSKKKNKTIIAIEPAQQELPLIEPEQPREKSPDEILAEQLNEAIDTNDEGKVKKLIKKGAPINDATMERAININNEKILEMLGQQIGQRLPKFLKTLTKKGLTLSQTLLAKLDITPKVPQPLMPLAIEQKKQKIDRTKVEETINGIKVAHDRAAIESALERFENGTLARDQLTKLGGVVNKHRITAGNYRIKFSYAPDGTAILYEVKLRKNVYRKL